MSISDPFSGRDGNIQIATGVVRTRRGATAARPDSAEESQFLDRQKATSGGAARSAGAESVDTGRLDGAGSPSGVLRSSSETNGSGSLRLSGFPRIPTTTDRIRERMNSYFDRKGFTDAEREQAVEILARHTASAGEVATLKQADELSSSQITSAIDKFHSEAEKQLAEFLGPQRAADVMSLQKAAAARRTVVADTEARCTAYGVPISSETADALAILCYKHAFPLPMPAGRQAAITVEQYRALTSVDADAIAAARAILTLEQLEHFKRSLAERFPIQ